MNRAYVGIALLMVLIAAHSAGGQNISRRTLPERPRISPYLNYFRLDPGPVGPYLSYVRPQARLQSMLAQQQATLFSGRGCASL